MSETKSVAQIDKLVISAETAGKIVSYLAGRPYIEVFQLMADMQQLEPLPAAPKPAEE